jgi:hypothetical protein
MSEDKEHREDKEQPEPQENQAIVTPHPASVIGTPAPKEDTNGTGRSDSI